MKEYILKNPELSKNLMIDYKKELNNEQYKVVTTGDGPCLVLAGAGSGKTRTLVYRVAYLLENGVPPNRILLVTFTNKAAKEMMNKIELLLKDKPKGLWGGTFHHIGNRMLRIYGKAIGIESNFNILDTADSKDLVKSSRNSVAIPNDKYFPKGDLIHKMISLSENLKEPISEIVRSRFPQFNEEDIKIISRIKQLYEEKKKGSNSLDFDDLLSQWNRLLLESEKTREKLSRQFKYILVDEYQDTNHIQGEVINHLAGANPNVLVVGDDSQSIYSFRGADVDNILNFPEDFADSKKHLLETNYRSTPEILELANQSIRYNKNKFDKNLHTNKKSSNKPVLAPLDDSYQQADFVCQRILDLQKDDGIELNEIAILFRAHFQSLELEMELNKRNIPYIMRGGLRFFEQAHIKDVVAYLRILSNYLDEVSWQRITQLQSGVGPATSTKIWEHVRTCSSLKEVLEKDLNLGAKASVGWNDAKKLLDQLSSMDVEDITTLIETILSSGYEKFIKAVFDNSQDRIADLEQLSIFAGRYESLDKFLADTALGEGFKGSTITEQPKDSEEAVVLSTIHQAKGLEWKAVFIISLVDGQFPNMKAVESTTGMEEERRLFYVATTRAMDQLYLTYPIFSTHTGNINQPSQFIKELPENVYEQWQIKNDFPDTDGDDIRYVDENEDDDVSTNFWKRVKARQGR
jgi:DNA helicase-2/ATP-dependent DNA helicase PcrA